MWGRPRPAALFAVLLLAAARPAVAKSTSPQIAALKKAIRFVARLEDDRAKTLLDELLRHAPPAAIAVRCHVYLGIIALNKLNASEARAEFKKAITIDPTAELPVTASPKARLVYGEAQKQLADASQLPTAPEGEQAAPSTAPPSEPTQASSDAAPPAPAEVSAQPALKPANHVPAYVVGGVGVAALAGGIIFGVEANTTNSQAQASTSAAGLEAKGVQVGTDGLIADICYGVSLAAGVTAVALFFTEKPGTGEAPAAAPTAAIVPIPGGAVLSAGGRF